MDLRKHYKIGDLVKYSIPGDHKGKGRVVAVTINYIKTSEEYLEESDLIDIPIGKSSDLTPMELIQEEAKKRFPIGCEFINTVEERYILKGDEGTYKIVNSAIFAGWGQGLLYEEGVWAILEQEKNIFDYSDHEIEEIVKDKFPIGCKFDNHNLGKGCKVNVTNNYDVVLKKDSKEICICFCKQVGSYTVYSNDKWALLEKYFDSHTSTPISSKSFSETPEKPASLTLKKVSYEYVPDYKKPDEIMPITINKINRLNIQTKPKTLVDPIYIKVNQFKVKTI